tara:strand:+ start:490 stop:807 length:318 start_codon:yes stop_codon:yes gene_type:complete
MYQLQLKHRRNSRPLKFESVIKKYVHIAELSDQFPRIPAASVRSVDLRIDGSLLEKRTVDYSGSIEEWEDLIDKKNLGYALPLKFSEIQKQYRFPADAGNYETLL